MIRGFRIWELIHLLAKAYVSPKQHPQGSWSSAGMRTQVHIFPAEVKRGGPTSLTVYTAPFPVYLVP